MHDSESIGSRLREERKKSGLTQDQIAEVLGISKRTQANYEAGSSDAPAWYLSKVMREPGFDVHYILSGQRTTATEASLSEVENLLVTQYRAITPGDQEAIRRFLKAMADDAVRQKN
ncbi:helix-turn-helix domain-containing protein [Pseudomonas sp. RA_105y_Pfl2_P56]|uniref:helix-turn-helix domain-containing protein n=1 Tax=Pseudomonas sp. RA_105y_Pfl2_P56 TaxID=3088701 RepID=UPI0030D72C11